MIAYWDTSAILGLIFLEPRSSEAILARNQTIQAYSWWWLQVEAHAAVLRRGATNQQKQLLANILGRFSWLDVLKEKSEDLRTLNQKHKLRSADLGHLFCFQQASLVLPEIELVCFDQEFVTAANHEGLCVWTS